jgi:sugar lactone lactonase YvrE
VDSSGNLYVALTSSRRVVKITPEGTLSIVAGTGQWFDPMALPRTDPVLSPGPATSVDLNRPTGVAVDSAGNLFILDGGYRKVLKVTTGGTLSVVAGSGSYGAPTAGPATSSDLEDPTGIAVDSSGNLYIADSGSKKVLKVTTGGTLSVFAGTGTAGLPTPGPATSSNLGTLNGIAVDSTGNVFITDSTNNLIDKITPAGALTVVAGTGYQASPTAGPVADSELGSTTRVATDSSGNLYILDSSYYLLEKVSFTPPVFVPDAPTALSATAGNGSASIAFTPGADGGASITKYQYKVGSGSWTDAVGTTSPITITGLTNGVAQSIRLRAVNSAGAGAASSPVSVTPRQAGPAVTSATPSGRTGIVVTFNLNPLPGTTVAYQSVVAYATGTNTVRGTCRTYGRQTTCFIGGLTRATNYDLRVTAHLPVLGKTWHNATFEGSILQVRTNR